MRSRELQTYLAEKTGARFSEIDQRTRVLRALNEISSGPRGLAAPHMNSVEIGYHLLALVAPRLGDVGDVTRRFATECRVVDEPGWKDLVDTTNLTIGTLLALAIQGDIQWLRSVEMAEHGLFAWVNTFEVEGRSHRFFFSVSPSLSSDAAEIASIGNRYAIGAAIISDLRDRYLADLDKLDEDDRVIFGIGAAKPGSAERVAG